MCGMPIVSAEGKSLWLSAETGYLGSHYHRHQSAWIHRGMLVLLDHISFSILKRRGEKEIENISWVNQSVFLIRPIHINSLLSSCRSRKRWHAPKSTRWHFPLYSGPSSLLGLHTQLCLIPHKWAHLLHVLHQRSSAFLTWVRPKKWPFF